MSHQSASAVLMVEPIHFSSNLETLQDNHFQHAGGSADPAVLQQRALLEFNALRRLLEQNGIEVHVFKDRVSEFTPDSIFPNNWFSTHPGKAVVYPMMAENRRRERRADIIELLKQRSGGELIDLTRFEQRSEFLEGTGSLVLDRVNKVAFAALSHRTMPGPLAAWCELLDFRAVTFRAADEAGDEIYHTNCMMGLGSEFAIACLDAVPDDAERELLGAELVRSGRKLIEITRQQMLSFCGNCLELRGPAGQKLIVMSQQAFDGFYPEQLAALEQCGQLIHTDLTTIEYYGGGSARCMLAELY